MPETVEYIKEATQDYFGYEHKEETGPQSSWSHAKDGIIDFLAGTAGGVACVYTGQPLDTIKVKMQTFSDRYPSSSRCFLETFRKDGIRGLYAGTVPALAANIAENSVLFAAYGFCQKGVGFLVGKKSVELLNPLENACAGSLAAIFSSFTLCPTELVKCRLQAIREMKEMGGGTLGSLAKGGKIGPWSLTRQIVREEGFLGLFMGLSPTFAREVPGYFFFFGGYELSRYLLTPKGKAKDDIGFLRTVVSGGLGGVSLWVMIFPADVVKSRVQIQGKGSFVGTMVSMVKAEGFRSMYNGLAPTIVRSFFATGALFVAYEWTKKTLHDL